MRNESVVAKITRAKRTAHDFINIDDTSKLAIFSADPVTDVRFAFQTFKACVKFFGGLWRTRPVPEKFPASSHRSQELVSTFRRGSLENRMFLHS